jgi:phosphate transport system substrate-binding protein
MNRSAIWSLKLVALAALLAACASVNTPTPVLPPASLTISGATSAIPLLTLLAERFQVRYPSVAAIVETGNSLASAEQVAKGAAELGAVSVVPPSEWWAVPLAVDGIAIVVHPGNPLENLTLREAHDIYSGRIWQWGELELEVGEDEITAVSREEASGARMIFEAVVMASGRPSDVDCEPTLTIQSRGTRAIGARPCETAPVTSMAVLMPSSAAVVDFVAAHPGAIGYVSRGHVGPQVKTVSIEDMPPTPEHVADGSYHLSQPIFLIAPREPTGVVRQFVDFCLGTEGQKIVAEKYVPVRNK